MRGTSTAASQRNTVYFLTKMFDVVVLLTIMSAIWLFRTHSLETNHAPMLCECSKSVLSGITLAYLWMNDPPIDANPHVHLGVYNYTDVDPFPDLMMFSHDVP